MPFADPTPTPADISFRLFGFPVRIHPFFWLVAVLLAPIKAPADVLVWAVAMVVSIIVHELGHAVLQRYWHGRPQITLYGFGGLASAPGVVLTPWRQVAISLAGPGAGFMLALVAFGVAVAIGLPLGRWPTAATDQLVVSLFLINTFWGVFNLLPIYPLDGGQVARELLTMTLRPDRGIVASLWLSIVTAAIAAAVLWWLTSSLWNLVLMGALAFSNYQTLEAYRRHYRGGY